MKLSFPSALLGCLILDSLLVFSNAIETLNVLVILVQWANHKDRALIPREQVNQMWNGPSNSEIVPGECIADYVESNSYGRYRIQAEVLDWYLMPQTEEEASFGNMGNSPSPQGPDIEDVLVPVLENAVSNGLDLSKYADENDYLRGIAFVHSGYAAEYGQTDCETGATAMNRIISKSWGVVEPIRGTPYTLSTFITLSPYRLFCNLQIGGVGVHIHEWMHAKYGIEDLYDTAGRYGNSRVATGGIGGYGIMSYPGGQKVSAAENYPGVLCPYHKLKLGYADGIEITYDGTYTARPSELYPDIYIISAPFEEGEYLLIENRQPLLSDKRLWEPGGIVIWHIDENAEGYGNFVRGGPFLDGWPGNGAHYKVAVLQADGKYELEMAINLGHIDDFWKAGDVLGPGNGESVATDAGTYPNTDSYVGGNTRVTGLVIDQFAETEPGVWSFRVQSLSPAPQTDIPVTQSPSEPTGSPTIEPSVAPVPTFVGSMVPSESPSSNPTIAPTLTRAPSTVPTSAAPSETPSFRPTGNPTASSLPSLAPTDSLTPSSSPSGSPTGSPSVSSLPTLVPSDSPSMNPSIVSSSPSRIAGRYSALLPLWLCFHIIGMTVG